MKPDPREEAQQNLSNAEKWAASQLDEARHRIDESERWVQRQIEDAERNFGDSHPDQLRALRDKLDAGIAKARADLAETERQLRDDIENTASAIRSAKDS